MTSERPYHVWARSNNREWFYLPISDFWDIVCAKLRVCQQRFKIQVHAYVLMDNHFHMLASTHQDHNLGEVMNFLQRETAKEVNRQTGRINHVFGGGYRASLVETAEYYFQVFKYVYRNPVEAGLSETVESYPYSTFEADAISCTSPLSGVAALLPEPSRISFWLNTPEAVETTERVKKGLRRTIYKPSGISRR